MAQGKITERGRRGPEDCGTEAEEAPLALGGTLRTKGFGCRASATGSVAYVVQTWEGGRGGKAKRITLTETQLDKAKIEAESKRVDFNKGCLTSPKQERIAKQREQLQQKTISEAASLYAFPAQN